MEWILKLYDKVFELDFNYNWLRLIKIIYFFFLIKLVLSNIFLLIFYLINFMSIYFLIHLCLSLKTGSKTTTKYFYSCVINTNSFIKKIFCKFFFVARPDKIHSKTYSYSYYNYCMIMHIYLRYVFLFCLIFNIHI